MIDESVLNEESGSKSRRKRGKRSASSPYGSSVSSEPDSFSGSTSSMSAEPVFLASPTPRPVGSPIAEASAHQYHQYTDLGASFQKLVNSIATDGGGQAQPAGFAHHARPPMAGAPGDPSAGMMAGAPGAGLYSVMEGGRPQFPIDTIEAMIEKVDSNPALLASINQDKFRHVQELLCEIKDEVGVSNDCMESAKFPDLAKSFSSMFEHMGYVSRPCFLFTWAVSLSIDLTLLSCEFSGLGASAANVHQRTPSADGEAADEEDFDWESIM